MERHLLAIVLGLLLTQPAPAQAGSGLQCLASGLCAVPHEPAVAPGVMFVAVGLVAAGAAGMVRERQRRRDDY